MVNEALHYNL